MDERVRFVPQLDASQQPPETALTLGQRLDFVRAFLHRRYVSILILSALALPVGALYAFTSPKTYSASATMMVETRKGPLDTSAGPLDAAWFDTQLQSLKSVNVLTYVVKQLHLADDPDFLRSDSTPVDMVRARLGLSLPELKSEGERVNRATGILASGLAAQRIGQSYLIRIDYHGRNSDLAGKITNEMVNGYIFD